MQLVKNSQASAVLGFSIVGFALPLYLLLLSGFPTVDALKVCAMIFVQIVSGALIWAQVMHPRQVDIVEGVGMGLALGSILAVIGHQLFLPTSLKDFGWLLPVVIAAVASVVWQATKGSHKNFVLEDVSGLFFVAFAVVLILKQWWWLLPLALPTGVALYLLSKSGGDKLRNVLKPTWLFVAVSFVAVTVLMVYLRQLNLDWWIRSWDVTMFESKAYSIAKFGPLENISLVGYPMDYHWFGIAWIGMIPVLNDLPAWTAIAQVGPIYAMVSISSVLWALGRRVQKNLVTPLTIVLLLAFATPALSPANPPNIISMIWGLSAMLVAHDYFDRPNPKYFYTFTGLGIAALAGKVSIGILILGGFALTDLIKSHRQKAELFWFAVRTIFLGTLAVAVFYLVIGGPNRLGNNTFKLSYQGPGYFFGVDVGRHPLIFALGTLGASLSLMQILLLPILALIWKLTDTRILIFTLGVFFSGYVPFLFTTDDGMAYFISNALNFAGIGAGIALVGVLKFSVEQNFLTRWQIFYTALLSFLIAKISEQALSLNWRELSLSRGGPTPILVAILSATILVYWLSTYLIIGRTATLHNVRFPKFRVLVFALFLVFANLMPNVFNQLSSPPLEGWSKIEIPYIGSSNVKAASLWVQENIPDSNVIATNRWCVEKFVNSCGDPKYFVVSATTRRRLLIEGPGRSIGYVGDSFELAPKFAKERLDLSRGFADMPTAEITARLRELGVDWFYLFKENTKNRNWEPYGTVKYENTEIAVIKLNDK